jgi:diguanylate cyclase (GGDEF)-like protein/PAS domain S-box-containing protein
MALKPPAVLWNRIVFRSLAAVTVVTALLGGIANIVIQRQVADRVHNEAQQRLGELIDTVESTASVAAFAKDEQLAKEVVQGLLRNSEVSRATIIAGHAELAHAGRAAAPDSSQAPIIRPLLSPFAKGESIGEIRLDANWSNIFSKVEDNARYTMLMLTGQLLLVIIGTAGMVFFVVVRPIKATSDRLHRLDLASGVALAVPEGHEQTEIGRLVGDINDLTGRLVSALEQERELRRRQEISQRMYQDLFGHSTSGIFVSNAEGQLVSFNPAFVELTWLPQVASERPRSLIEPAWDDSSQVRELLRRSAASHVSSADDFLLRGRRGDERWLQVAILSLGDGSLQGTVTDVTARKHEEISARRLAITDSLTGFANREGLLLAFAKVAQQAPPPFAAAMINLDGFKRLNDAMGFPVGDKILLKVAERIRDAARPGDFLARIGGDSFVMILAGMSRRDEVEPRVEALRARLAEPYLIERGPTAIGASMGIAFFPRDGADMPQLLRCAELAISEVRESGRASGAHAHEFFEPQLQVAVERRRRLEDDLRLAVSNGELHLAFQPIVDLRSGRLAGAEALLRWQHAERGLVSPEVFIPLAERLGLIGEIGRKVLDEACFQVARWRREGHDIYVSVNVSAIQIPNELTPQAVLDAMQRQGLPSEAIAIEITEGMLMRNVVVAQTWISSLRAAGLRVYLDDFGTGYSSLSYLKRFQMDTVKIDKSFITDMNADNSDRTLVSAIITMAGSLGLKVVAEGVEELSQLALLREMGCGFGQGYLFSQAIPADEFGAMANRINAELAGKWA